MPHISLDEAMKDGSLIFQMPPAESQNPGAPPAVGEDPAAGTQPAVGEAPVAGEKPGDGTPPQPRFKTHDEAEKGYVALQSRTSRAEQTNAQLRQQLEEYRKKEAAEAQRIQQDDHLKFAVDKNNEALAAIDELKADDPDYRNKVATIWAQTGLAIDRDRQARTAMPATGDDGAQGGDDGAQGGDDGAQGGDDGAQGGDDGAQGAEGQPAIDTVHSLLEKGKLSEEEQVLFWGMSRNAPTHDQAGNKLNLEQQVSMVMEKARNFYAAQRSKLMQEMQLPLDRGGSFGGPPPGGGGNPGPARVLSLDEAMQEADRSRTLA